jgi:hypothetical protein
MAGGDEKAAMQARQQFMLDGENQKKFPEIGQLLERITAHSEKIGDDKIVSNLRNPLSTTYHSATPYLLGDDDTQFMVRYKVVPSGQPEDGAFDNNKDSLGAAMSKQLEELSRPATFTFIISRYNGNDLEGTAEDPTVVWGATIEAPVAHITIYPQDIASEEAKLLCESLSFTPWHSLPNHQPIGGINRARLSIYQASSKIRHETTGQARVEPEHTW